MCFPKSCLPEDINKNYRELTAKSFQNITININGNLVTIPLTGNLTIGTRAEDCFTRDNRSGMPEEYPWVTVLIYIIFSLIGFLTLIGTGFDILQKRNEKEIQPRALKTKMILCFSAYSNGKHLLSTKSSGIDHLNCLNDLGRIGP